MNDEEEGEGRETGDLHPLPRVVDGTNVSLRTDGIHVVPSLDQVNQRGQDGPGSVESQTIQHKPEV